MVYYQVDDTNNQVIVTTIAHRSKRLFEKSQAVILGTYRSLLTPLSKGGPRVKVPLFKGDLGGSKNIRYTIRDFSNTLLSDSRI
jgi:hypothetical protein